LTPAAMSTAVAASPSLGSVVLEALYALRMELSFLGALLVVWACNRFVAGTLHGAGKRRADRKKPAPPTLRPAARAPGEGCSAPVAGASRRHSGDIDARNPTRAQLCDPVWVSAAVQQLSRVQTQKAIDVYRAAVSAGLELERMPDTDSSQLFMSLVCSAIRSGRTDEALRVLRDCRARGPGVSVAMLSSATKLSTSKHFFSECIEIFDFAAEDRDLVVNDRSIWSCLLFCAVESHQYSRCDAFFSNLKEAGKPSQKDYGNMVRAASSQGDWTGCLKLISEMGDMGIEVDSVIYNTALATCVAAGQTDHARALLSVMESSQDSVADVITYNTLAKGYGKLGQLDKCFELYQHMRDRGITPSQVTYGILLDCCINERQVERAAEVFDTMTKEGCVMNTVLYTTLIKGFARAEQVDQAMKVYERMRADAGQGITPDLITFSILIKANSDAGRMEEALKLLERMMDLHLVPDEVVFNNLLSGCVRTSDVALGRQLYRNMVEVGLRPSSATFSILIRLYAGCKVLDEAVEMLKLEPAARGVEPESRLFVQLAQACLRERQGRRAVEVYKMLLARGAPTAAMHGSLLGMCVKLNMLDTGCEILALAVEARGRVDPRDAAGLREALLRKKKTPLAAAVAEAVQQLGGPGH